MGERIAKRRAGGDESIVDARLNGEDIVLNIRASRCAPVTEMQLSFENLEGLQALLS
jgi:hypothetical protein